MPDPPRRSGRFLGILDGSWWLRKVGRIVHIHPWVVNNQRCRSSNQTRPHQQAVICLRLSPPHRIIFSLKIERSLSRNDSPSTDPIFTHTKNFVLSLLFLLYSVLFMAVFGLLRLPPVSFVLVLVLLVGCLTRARELQCSSTIITRKGEAAC